MGIRAEPDPQLGELKPAVGTGPSRNALADSPFDDRRARIGDGLALSHG